MDVSKEALFFDMKNHSRECGYTIYIHTQREEVRYHYHEYYEVFLTETDGIIHYVNGKEEVLSGGSLVFIRPQDKHTIYCDKDFRYINLNFSINMQSLGFSVERWLEKVNHVHWSNGIVSHFKWKWTAG